MLGVFLAAPALAPAGGPGAQERLEHAAQVVPLAPLQHVAGVGQVGQAAHPTPGQDVAHQAPEPVRPPQVAVERQEGREGLEDLGLVGDRDGRVRVQHPAEERGARARRAQDEERPGAVGAASGEGRWPRGHPPARRPGCRASGGGRRAAEQAARQGDAAMTSR